MHLSDGVSKAERVLRQEIEILQEIDHPSIIRYLASFEENSKLMWVLELCRGGTLHDLIEKQAKLDKDSTDNSEKPLSDEDASKIMRRILEAVSYLHHQGIVHRDLKPENILLCNKNDISSIKLIDFGLTAKYNDAWPLSLLDDHCGTVLYMAPEVALRQEYSKSIDVWSLGIIMYNLLSGGEHPLHQKGESFEKFETKLRNKEKFRFTDSFSNLAKDLIKKMTSYSPVYRYNVDQALKHPWITRSHETKVPLTYFELFNIMDYQEKLKKVTIALSNLNFRCFRQSISFH